MLHADGSDLAEVRRVAGEADVVVVVAGTRWDEVGEYITDDEGLRPSGPAQKRPLVIKVPLMKPIVISGGDRVPLSLKPRDLGVIQAAAKANPRCVVALVGGSVFTMEEWRHDVPAIVMAWYFGMEGGHALARVLFGDVNPSGKMPLTTPKDEKQLPFFDEFADTIQYGPYHGYTLFDKKGAGARVPVRLRPELHDLRLRQAEGHDADGRPGRKGGRDRRRHEHRLRARARRSSQLYVGFEGARVERPVKLLRAFARVALAPGETKTVPLSVAAKDLAWYDAGKKALADRAHDLRRPRRTVLPHRRPAEVQLPRRGSQGFVAALVRISARSAARCARDIELPES